MALHPGKTRAEQSESLQTQDIFKKALALRPEVTYAIAYCLDSTGVQPWPQNPPPFEKLVGDLADAYSKRINIQHRLVYEVFSAQQVVRVLSMWTHHE
jgi:Txe/YoeB family toxin of toxin-antitoxin system